MKFINLNDYGFNVGDGYTNAKSILQVFTVDREDGGYSLCIHINTRVNSAAFESKEDRDIAYRQLIADLNETGSKWISPADFKGCTKGAHLYNLLWAVCISDPCEEHNGEWIIYFHDSPWRDERYHLAFKKEEDANAAFQRISEIVKR